VSPRPSQDAIAALHLGCLCDGCERAALETVVEVRVEAPEDVDDVEVALATESRELVQAKVRLPARLVMRDPQAALARVRVALASDG
jgi:hypothetical protein